MSRPEPQSCCACLVSETDAAGIRKRLVDLAREGYPVVLAPEQVRVLLLQAPQVQCEPFDWEASRW